MNESQFNALPLDQRKAIQQQLKDQGFYAGSIDGQYGAGTATAFKLRDEAQTRAAQQEAQNRIAEQEAAAQADKSQAEADRIRAETEAERQRIELERQYSEQANTPEGVAARIAANTAAPLTGVVTGRAMGGGINKLADLSQESRNRALQGAAQDRLEGRTTREGARIGTERSGAMPSRNSALRVGGRMLPHMISGAAMIGKGGAMLADDGGEAFYADQANRAAGLGMIGTGAGLLERGAAYAVNPGVSPDARAIAIMESNQLRRGQPTQIDRGTAQVAPNRLLHGQRSAPAAQTPPQRALPAPAKQSPQQHSARLANAVAATGGNPSKSKSANYQALRKSLNDSNATEVARALNLPEGTARRTIMQRARELLNTRGVSSWALPIAAGAFAYGMTPERASASEGGDPAVDQGEALTNAAIAGGTAYGANRLLQAIPKSIGTAVSATAPMLAPQMGADMTDYTPEEINMARNWMARNLPEAMQVGAVGEAARMAQVPERSPARVYENAYRMPGTQQADTFEDDIAELQRLLNEMDGNGQQSMPQPQFRVPMASYGPQNRLMAAR